LPVLIKGECAACVVCREAAVAVIKSYSINVCQCSGLLCAVRLCARCALCAVCGPAET
jgi:hypothetical protein